MPKNSPVVEPDVNPFQDDDDPLMTYTEIAEMLDIGVTTLRNYRWKGMLPPEDFRKEGFRMWRKSTILGWHNSRTGPGWWAAKRLQDAEHVKAAKEAAVASYKDTIAKRRAAKAEKQTA